MLGLTLVGVAALIHVYVFLLESFMWTRESTRRIFRIRTAEQAETLRVMAFNQGFYNLFLAVSVIVGIALVSSGETTAGMVAITIGAASMVLAAVVLRVSSRGMTRGALIQGLAPLLGLVLLWADTLT